MEIEHNQTKMQDFTIPLFQLEQRVEHVENLLQGQSDSVGFNADQVAMKMGSKLKTYLPQVWKLMEDFENFKSLTNLKLDKSSENQPQEGTDKADSSNLKFMINNLSSELRFQKSQWNDRTRKQIEMLEYKQKETTTDIGNMK